MEGKYPDLKGKKVIVVGVGGIGSAIAKGFLEQGCRVFAIDRNERTLNKLFWHEKLILIKYVADVTNHQKFISVIQEIGSRYGVIRSFVYTAGIGTATAVDEFVNKLPEKLFGINVIGFIYGLKAVIPFLEEGSSVTVIGSLNASRSEPGMAVYDSTKAALTQFIKTASVDLGPKGIRLNVVAPGMIRTPQTVKELENPTTVEKVVNATSLRRIGEPIDIAPVVVALASNDFSFLTGASLAVDGGLGGAMYSAIEKQTNE